jgi:hypothetical protein
MKKILLLVWLLFVAPLAHAGMSLSPGMVAHTHADANTGGGTLALSGTLSSTKACASGYTRVGPNYCAITDGTTGQVLVSAASATIACTQSPALTGVTDAKAVQVTVNSTVFALNAAAQRGWNAQLYGPTGSTCSVATVNIGYLIREFVAVAGTTVLGQATASYLVKSSTTGQF